MFVADISGRRWPLAFTLITLGTGLGFILEIFLA
jgi:hypothetical protein